MNFVISCRLCVFVFFVLFRVSGADCYELAGFVEGVLSVFVSVLLSVFVSLLLSEDDDEAGVEVESFLA